METTTHKYKLFFDGCSKGNPGKAGIGAVIYCDDAELWAASKYLGDKRTNNDAEFHALIFGLESALEHDIKILDVYGDSLLVIRQITEVYQVKNPNLLTCFKHAKTLVKQFDKITFTHVYREFNKRADELSNMGLLC